MTEPRELRIVLAGGGSAGHVNPMLATASELASRPGGARCEVIGTAQGLEADLVPEAGLPLHTIPRVPVPRRPSLDYFRMPARLRRAVSNVGKVIKSSDAQVVVGFGGYVSAPAYLAARRAGVPFIIHEQNARPGLANRLGSRSAAAAALTFPSTPLRARKGQTKVTGLPLRAPIAKLVADREAGLAGQRRAAGAKDLGLDPDRPIVLVTGGSLGAKRLNVTVPIIASDLRTTGAQVIHLAGKGKAEPVRTSLEAQAAASSATADSREMRDYHVLEYLSEMERALACADIVVCRAGAGTVAELSALGLPAAFVPLPHGNGEQRLNATDVVAAGGGLMVDDDDLNATWLRDNVIPLITDDTARANMSAAARSSGPGDGSGPLADLIAEVAGAGQ